MCRLTQAIVSMAFFRLGKSEEASIATRSKHSSTVDKKDPSSVQANVDISVEAESHHMLRTVKTLVDQRSKHFLR